MSGNRATNYSESENTCVVCFKIVDAFSVGKCDHPVCFECSTRMRVLCNQFECPICRQELPWVVFTKEVEPFSNLKPKVENLGLEDSKYKIYFATSSLQRRYYHLLDHECFICKRSAKSSLFKTFDLLNKHMKREHDLLYCELCVSNLKIFTFERKCYTRVELATHRRKGDVDNTSHRGHPLCEFCENRFMDNDELFRHLRRDHFFCHFCDADGKHHYYDTYNHLREHYVAEHFLCEEGDCKHERFTSVFRTDIDFKAHYASEHSRYLSRAANRQARTLEVQFTIAPRSRPDGANIRGGRHHGSSNTERYRDSDAAISLETYLTEPGGTGGGPPENPIFRNPLAAENFPSLGGETTSTLHTVSNVITTSKINPLSKDNFPVLGGSVNNNKQSAVTITKTVCRPPVLKGNSASFPSLGEASSSSSVRLSINSNIQDHSKVPKVSIRVNHQGNREIGTKVTHSSSNGHTVSVRPKTAAEAFPALTNNAKTLNQPQWVQQQSKKQVPKSSKVAPAPSIPSSSLSDFPTLGKDSKGIPNKVSSASVWVNLNNFNSNNIPTNNNQGLKSKHREMTASHESLTKSKDGKNKTGKKNSKTNDDLANSVNKIDININSEGSKNKPITNGFTKKKSELNVEVTEPNSASKTINKPPPGFNVKPPPGFNNFPTSNNDLIFTNSSGKNYQISAPQFFPPPNFKIRNQHLIEKLKDVLDDSGAIQQFKIFSDMFRSGDIQADKYYKHCEDLMRNEFDALFPELLVLLPNVQRQQDLYAVLKNKNRAKTLEACATCQQVVLIRDMRDHLSNHMLDNHFPVLNHAAQENNAWHK